jgi:23S rRNA pseudouridine1911/1915/1917 synthase
MSISFPLFFMQEFDALILPDALHSRRLDKVLASQYPHFSRAYFQYLISEGAVLVNNRVVKKSCIVSSGDEIQVQFILTKELALEPEEIPLDILFEDEHLLAINKPAGLVVHPAAGNWSHTFVNALLFYCKTLEQDNTLRPGIVHRLDKDTSGVLVAAKTRAMHQALTELFAERKVEKRYFALCYGTPTQTLIDQPIGRHLTKRKEMAVIQSGRPARTHLQVVKSMGHYSLLDIRLETGRTHQIRVHLKHIGHPLVGDAVYASSQDVKRFNAARHMLHAYRLSFIHPITREPLVINAPLADDIAQMI